MILLGFAIAVAILWAGLWVTQLAQVMLLSDADLPGRPYDKVLWVALFVLAPPLAPLAFILWRRVIAAARRSESSGREGEPAAEPPMERLVWVMATLAIGVLVAALVAIR